MSQLLKKFALLTACAALAFCFAARPAQAQMVVPGGVGEHLLFAYWSTADGMNTNVNIHSPLDVTDGVARNQNVVYVRVRSGAADRNTVVSFNICLMAGDSWTATLSAEGLMVMDEGECDGNIRQPGSSPANQNIDTPGAGEMVDLGDTDSGYLEAWLTPRMTLQDDTKMNALPDKDLNPENADQSPISGTAMLVSPMSGFSSSYNAVALTDCDIMPNDHVLDVAGTETTLGVQLSLGTDNAAGGTGTAMDDVDGDGCWTTTPFDAIAGTANNPTARTSPVINGVLRALQGITNDSDTTPSITDGIAPPNSDTDNDRDILTGRWTAISDDHVMSHTKVVLTFPTNHLNYGDGTSDPVSIHVYDDMSDGQPAFSSAGVTLNMAVNMCTFMAGDDMMTMLSCNDEEIGSIDASSGGFRIFNNTPAAASDAVKEFPGLTTDNQTPKASLGAIGLVCSYFEGTDGMQYDQITPIQTIDVDRDGNDPDATTDNEDNNRDTGLDMF